MCTRPLHIKTGTVPCGICYECRQKKIRDWSIRNEYESMSHQEKCFITLTYNDENLPISKSKVVYDKTMSEPTPTLVKYDLQQFIKNLRNKGYKFRYYAVGEYGSKSGRPHYHALIYGQDFNDKLQELADIWAKGFVYGGTVKNSSINYVTRYVEKKLYGTQRTQYIMTNTIPEFTLCSKGRGEQKGIGYKYYKDNIEANLQIENELKIIHRGKEKNLPEYYKRKYYEENPTEENLAYKEAIAYINRLNIIKAQDDACILQKKDLKYKYEVDKDNRIQRERNVEANIKRIHSGGKI